MNDGFVRCNWEEFTNRLLGGIGAAYGFCSSGLQKDKLHLEQLVKSQVREIVHEFYSGLRFGAETEEILAGYGERAEILKQQLLESLKRTEATTQKEVEQALLLDSASGNALSRTADNLRAVMEKREAAFGIQLQSSAEQILRNMILWDYNDLGCHYYRFVSFGENCEICQDLNGKIFKMGEGDAGKNLAPMHPNCDCATAVLDSNGAVAFVVCNAEELRRVSSSSRERKHTEKKKVQKNASQWYTPILRIPSDALQMFRNYMTAQNNRFYEADGNPLKLLDWLLLGIPSSFWHGMQQRSEAMQERPSLYNISNYLTMGLPEPIKGAALPEERFSLQHLIDSFNAAGTVFGAYGATGKVDFGVYKKSGAVKFSGNEFESELVDTLAFHKGSARRYLGKFDDFGKGFKSFDQMQNEYAKVYAKRVNSDRVWSWNNSIPVSGRLTDPQMRSIKQYAIKKKYIPKVQVKKTDGLRYGLADFKAAGLVRETAYLPQKMWQWSNGRQFDWLDKQRGGTLLGYTWHHTEIPGKMELVPSGIHHVYPHNGGRTAGMWAHITKNKKK